MYDNFHSVTVGRQVFSMTPFICTIWQLNIERGSLLDKLHSAGVKFKKDKEHYGKGPH
jgi:hypothetical protein